MVEEDEYRSTYREVNERRCVFEKAVLSHRCACICSTRFYLADREGIRCDSVTALQRCKRLSQLLHDSARFALGLSSIEGELPHTKEIKVQTGGLLGLQKVLRPALAESGEVGDIAGLVACGEKTWGSLEALPFSEIVKSITAFEGRRRRPRR